MREHIWSRIEELVNRASPTKQVRRQYTNELTGETLALVHEEPATKRRPTDKREREPFMMIFLDRAPELARMNLTGTDYAVLIALTAEMGFDEPFRYFTKGVAEDLGIKPTAVSRSVRNLKQKKLLFAFEDRSVLLNPNYFWRGTKEGRAHALAFADKATGGQKNRSGSATETVQFRPEPG